MFVNVIQAHLFHTDSISGTLSLLLADRYTSRIKGKGKGRILI